MAEFSVVTIVKERRKQLANLLYSISQSSVLPNDVQIVCMDDSRDVSIPHGVNATIHTLNSSDSLPLAAARNAGVGAALTDTIVFVDVDCIVSPSLFENMTSDIEADQVITVYPLYLPDVPNDGDYERLRTSALPHPGRASLPAGTKIPYYQFWSIVFAIKRKTFMQVGGFDETFTGYGAEDTDFAKSFDKAGMTLSFVEDYVLHQYHTKYDPPLNHFDAIIQNATTYCNKWGELPMRRWLDSFENKGLIGIEDDRIRIIRRPTMDEVKACLSTNPY